MAGTVMGAAPLTVGVRARSTARGPTAPKAYSMASYSGLKAKPLAMARDRVATLGDKVTARSRWPPGPAKAADPSPP